MIIFITTLTYAGASTLRTIKADKQTKLITALKKKTHTLTQTNSGNKHCEFSHFCKLDVSYAIQHTFSNVILGDRLRK